ncbi:MAG: ABC transporter permease, partial [Stackebrandtia sp.]
TYSAYALYVWLSGRASKKAVAFARVSALIALSIGAAGQIAYHLMAAPDDGAGPVITATVACIPVAVLGMGASLAHLVKNTEN